MNNYKSNIPACEDHGPDTTLSVEQNLISLESKENQNPNYKHHHNLSVKKENLCKSLDKSFFQFILRDSADKDGDGKITVDKCVRDCTTVFQFIWQIELYRLFLTIRTKEHLLVNVINVIVKRLQSEEYQKLYNANPAAQIEHYAYKICNILNIYAYGKFPAPYCYFSNEEMIIISNLDKEGYKSCCDNKNSITLEQCRFILQALARFHAATFVLKYLEPCWLTKFKNLVKHDLFYAANSTKTQQQAILENILSIHQRREPTEENSAIIKALEYLLKYIKNDIKDLLCDAKNNYVFCHGNLLAKNCLFKKGENEEVVVKFVHFQKCSIFSLASDLVYLFFVNLQPDDYIAHKKILLKCYYSYLTKHIEERGIAVDSKLSFKWLIKEINRFTEYGIIYGLWSLLHLYTSEIKNNREEVAKEFYNERMEKWVKYYAKIYHRKLSNMHHK